MSFITRMKPKTYEYQDQLIFKDQIQSSFHQFPSSAYLQKNLNLNVLFEVLRFFPFSQIFYRFIISPMLSKVNLKSGYFGKILLNFYKNP